jgi:pentatricopeptide repeat protein
MLEKLSEQHQSSWSSVIAGYAKQGRGHEALKCLERMQSAGLLPDAITFVCILNACGNAGAIEEGQKVYDEILSRDLLKNNVVLGTALVDMYAKCGGLAKAEQILEELPIRNVVTWCALIAGYAQQGQGLEALVCFKRMQSEGISPNDVTLLSVLSACSHSGLLDEAQMLFSDITRKYGIVPSIEHHACMVVAFGYAGLFDKAVAMIKAMPSCGVYTSIWLALLGACRKWENLELGRLAFDQTLQLDESCGAAYMLMASIFSTFGMREDVESVEAMRRKYATTSWDERGKFVCWADVSGHVHSFSTEDFQHIFSIDLYSQR